MPRSALAAHFCLALLALAGPAVAATSTACSGGGFSVLGHRGEVKVDVPSAGRYFVEVADCYDDASAPAAFTLSAGP